MNKTIQEVPIVGSLKNLTNEIYSLGLANLILLFGTLKLAIPLENSSKVFVAGTLYFVLSRMTGFSSPCLDNSDKLLIDCPSPH